MEWKATDRLACLTVCLTACLPAWLSAAYLPLIRLPALCIIDLYVKAIYTNSDQLLIDLLSGTCAFLNAAGVGVCGGQNTPCIVPEKVRLSM